ncbi:MAG: hypothetical protein U0359_10260 [Byssovorax sp.]
MRSAPSVQLILSLAACSGARDRPGPRPDDDPPRPTGSTAAPIASPACVPEGVETPPLDERGMAEGTPGACCDGLALAPIFKGSIIRLDECELARPARFFCVRCGDGRCGRGETMCNCPADCHL